MTALRASKGIAAAHAEESAERAGGLLFLTFVIIVIAVPVFTVEKPRQRIGNVLHIAAQLLYEVNGIAVAVPDHGEKDVFRPYIAVTHPPGEKLGGLQRPLAARGQVVGIDIAAHALPVNLCQLFSHRVRLHTVLVENGLRGGSVGFEKSEKDMLRADEGVSHLLRILKRAVQGDI